MITTEEKTVQLKKDRKPRPIEIARDTLKALSEEVKDLVDDGMFATINDAIMETLYKQGKHRTFATYMGWQKQGKQVRKGEKAFLLWGRPKNQDGNPVIDEEVQEEENEVETTSNPTEETYKFYPIAYLFSNAQVEDIVVEKSEEDTTIETQGKPLLEPLPYE